MTDDNDDDDDDDHYNILIRKTKQIYDNLNATNFFLFLTSLSLFSHKKKKDYYCINHDGIFFFIYFFIFFMLCFKNTNKNPSSVLIRWWLIRKSNSEKFINGTILFYTNVEFNNKKYDENYCCQMAIHFYCQSIKLMMMNIFL